MSESTALSPSDRSSLIEEGIKIKATLVRDTKRLKAITLLLSEDALISGEHEPLEDAEREGKQVKMRSDRHILPVIISSDALMQSFAQGSTQANTVMDAIETAVKKIAPDREPQERHEISRQKFALLFKYKPSYEIIVDDGVKFRRLVRDQFGESLAPDILSACLSRDKNGVPKSKVYPDWDRATPLPANDGKEGV